MNGMPAPRKHRPIPIESWLMKREPVVARRRQEVATIDGEVGGPPSTEACLVENGLVELAFSVEKLAASLEALSKSIAPIAEHFTGRKIAVPSKGK